MTSQPQATEECEQCEATGLYGYVHGQHMPCPACKGTGRVPKAETPQAPSAEPFSDELEDAFNRFGHNFKLMVENANNPEVGEIYADLAAKSKAYIRDLYTVNTHAAVEAAENAAMLRQRAYDERELVGPAKREARIAELSNILDVALENETLGGKGTPRGFCVAYSSVCDVASMRLAHFKELTGETYHD